MINFDFWYGDTIKEVAKVSCYFSDCDTIYRGNLYNKYNKIIGDYSTPDSVELEKMFPGIFGN